MIYIREGEYSLIRRIYRLIVVLVSNWDPVADSDKETNSIEEETLIDAKFEK